MHGRFAGGEYDEAQTIIFYLRMNLSRSFHIVYPSLSPAVGTMTSQTYTQVGNIIYYLNLPSVGSQRI